MPIPSQAYLPANKWKDGSFVHISKQFTNNLTKGSN